jgi:hypothetical protein
MPIKSCQTSIIKAISIKPLLTTMLVIIYVLTIINNRLLISESRDDSNLCTSYRGNLIHMTHMLFTPVHIHHSYASYGQSPYMATFHDDSTELDESHCSQEKGTPNYIPSTPADWSMGPHIQFLSPHSYWNNRHSHASVDENATSIYWAHISSMWSVHSILGHGG